MSLLLELYKMVSFDTGILICGDCAFHLRCALHGAFSLLAVNVGKFT
jgi:hypothetical protein